MKLKTSAWGRGVLSSGLARSEEEEEGREEDEGYEEGQGKAGALARQSFEEGRHGWAFLLGLGLPARKNDVLHCSS